jgi:hypothetical protein
MIKLKFKKKKRRKEKKKEHLQGKENWLWKDLEEGSNTALAQTGCISVVSLCKCSGFPCYHL